MPNAVETPIGTITPDHFRPGSISHQVFAGPKFFYALFNPNDRLHVVARAFLEFVREDSLPYRHVVCNEHVIDESATRLKKQASMRNAAKFLSTLDESSLYRVEFVTEPIFGDALDRFVDWSDQSASLTDFVVAHHMANLGISHILTFDQHYGAFEVTMLPYRGQN